MLYNLIILPIESLIDWLFSFIINRMSGVGVIGAIFGVSMLINFLALPLYNVAERIQKREHETVKKLSARVAKIKKAFRGDERFMMLQTYYRQNNYHPIYALRGSLSILIQIPFFIAAYHYLSHSEVLNGASFSFISDLGKPDSLFILHLGGKALAVNVLPILMTAINVISSFIYTRDATKGEKAQLYSLSLIFLVLLYNSPSGLVIYWILNNLFSLAKNIVSSLKHSRLITYIAISLIIIQVPIYVIKNDGFTLVRITFSTVLTLILLSPFTIHIVKTAILKHSNRKIEEEIVFASKVERKENFVLFLLSLLGLTLLCGLLIPSSTIATSPIEFSFIGNTASPLSYIKTALETAAGFFLLWACAVYFLSSDKVKKILSFIMPLLLFIALVNVYIFKLGNQKVDITFTMENNKAMQVISLTTFLLQLVIAIILTVLFFFIRKLKKQGVLAILVFSLCMAESAFSLTKINYIGKTYHEYKIYLAKKKSKSEVESKDMMIKPIFHLNKMGKNVMVIFLDRAISSFMEPSFLDLPELKEKLRGCTYYPNTLSLGPCTVLASPSVVAGYEYTPDKINARENELLKDKHNEALLVMPTLFAEGGFHATFIDPPFVNYRWSGDLDIFENKKDIKALDISGKCTRAFELENGIATPENMDNEVRIGLKNFVTLQILPQAARIPFYLFCRNQTEPDISAYMLQFPNLYYFDKLTDFTAEKNQFFLIDNETTHSPTFLTQDFIKPAKIKEEIAKTHFQCEDEFTMQHYHVFLASLKAIGSYFDYLRENDCFDNTRIIIVSDHGKNIPLPRFKNFKNVVTEYASAFNPFFLVKDFNSNDEFKTDNSFMTNADTILLAKKDLPLSDKNPLTGTKFEAEKEGGVIIRGVFGTEWNGETLQERKILTLLDSFSYHVQDNIFDEKNWIPLDEFEGYVSNAKDLVWTGKDWERLPKQYGGGEK